MRRPSPQPQYRYTLLVVAVLAIGLWMTAAQAAEFKNPIAAKEFKAVIATITKWAAAIAAPLTTLMVLVAGLLYMTGGGNQDRITKAHRALTWAIIGFAITLLSTVATLLIENILGTK